MANNVSTPTAAVAAMRPDWELAAVLLGGTRAIRAAGEEYLPRFPAEEPRDYAARLKGSTLFPGYSRTVETLAGKPFAKPVTIGDDVPSEIKKWCEDIDLEGRNLHAFLADQMAQALGMGMAGVLVDFPRVEQPPKNLAEERAQGLRPYFVAVKARQIVGWRAARVAGVWTITQLRLMENVVEPDGEFGEAQAEQVRVLEPGRWRIFRRSKAKPEEWIVHDEGVTSLGYVPFVPFYGLRTGFMTSRPPLIELAHLNVEHWQSASDQRNILHVARVPILAMIGVDESNSAGVVVAASNTVRLPIDADMKFVEHTGAAIQAGADDLKALEERMRQAGAELLVLKSGPQTATEVASDNEVGKCALQRIVQSFEDAADQCLQIMADWANLGQGGHIEIFQDFGVATLAEASEQLLLQAQQGGVISKETLINEMKRRGTLSAEVDAEEEAERVEAEGPTLGSLENIDPLTGLPVKEKPTGAEA